MSHFVDVLNSSDVIRVDGGPLLSGFEYDLDDEFVTFSWDNGEGGTDVVIISPSEAATAEPNGNGFLVHNERGEVVEINVFTLTPKYPIPPKLSSGWTALFYKANNENVVSYHIVACLIDDMVHDFIGGQEASAANNGGFLAQVEAVYKADRGQEAGMICSLSRRLSESTPYSKDAWAAALSDPDSVSDSLAEYLRALSMPGMAG